MSANTHTAPTPPPHPPRSTPPPRLDAFRVTFLLFLLAVVFSLPGLGGETRQLDYLGNFLRFWQRFWPPDFSIWRQILSGLLETFRIAVVATLAAILASLPLAAAASHNLAPLWLVLTARLLLNLIRSIPSLVWALLAVAVLGANPLAGVTALALYSTGYLGKFFSDAIESADPGVAEALKAGGADALQILQFGLWPHAKPLIWSHSLWMLEYNIRSAAIIGYVGAGGIGIYLHIYQEYGQWNRFAAVLLGLLAIVVLLDAAGQLLRRQFSHQTSG